MLRAAPCDLPAASKLRDSLPQIDYLDSYAIGVARPDQSMISLYAAALDHLPRVFRHLLVLRSILVRPFGIAGVSHRDLTQPIDTSKSYAVGDRVGRWTLYGQFPDELITGADDKHLDFRVSVLREGGARVALSTAVMTHNAFGRTYLAAILPFHRYGVPELLTTAAAAGRL
jgi:Protein of unknown function (DUF2867)